jgi:hypothetical protein
MDWKMNPYLQVEGGFLGGLVLGAVPFGGVGQQLLDAADVLPHGTPEARRGLAVGLIVGGIVSVAGGATGEILGGVASVSGIGAALGVPAIVVSTGLVVGGVGNIAAGIRGLLTTGSGLSTPRQPPQGAAPAARGTKKLPALDRTGKVHGELPKAEELGRYSTDELRQLQGELRQSVQERIRKTVEMGSHKPHGERQAAEQELIQQIEKHLEGR